jgi:serine/threonine-protein kinase RsbW
LRNSVSRFEEIVVPAEPARLGGVREELRAFLSAGFDDETLGEIVLAVNEACANVCIHAYPTGVGSMTVRMTSNGRSVSIEIEDGGRGIAAGAPSPGAGLGLRMMRELSAGCEIVSGPSGTLVRLRFEPAVGVSDGRPG